VVEVATDTAVLNADDPLTARMAAHTRARHVCYVTDGGRQPLVAEHVRAGGRAVALETGVNGQMITIYDRGAHIPLVWTHLIPAALDGRAAFNVQNAMFAAAMAFSMGVRLEDVRHGLRTFTSTFYQAPGRLNVYEGHPFTVLFDYAHNASAVEALVDTARRLEVQGRRIMVLAAPGDRRDDDIRATARAAAGGGFDHYVCRRDDNARGRGDDEVPRLLAETLVDAGVPAGRVEVVVREPEAIDRALGMADRGDLVVICADALERGWRQIEGFGAPRDASGRRATAAAAANGGAGDVAPAAAEAHGVPREPAPGRRPGAAAGGPHRRGVGRQVRGVVRRGRRSGRRRRRAARDAARRARRDPRPRGQRLTAGPAPAAAGRAAASGRGAAPHGPNLYARPPESCSTRPGRPAPTRRRSPRAPPRGPTPSPASPPAWAGRRRGPPSGGPTGRATRS
jgi:hypothetical protein